MPRGEGLRRQRTLLAAVKARLEIAEIIRDPATRLLVLEIIDRAIDDPIAYADEMPGMSPIAARARADVPPEKEAFELRRDEDLEESPRTYVKVDGAYPDLGTASFHRHKDRLILSIDRVGRVPAHSLSIEMLPVLREFRSLVEQIDYSGIAELTRRRCPARLRRGKQLIARCHLEKGHPGQHCEIGSTFELDNWPPMATVRWSQEVTEFRPYDHRKEGTWRWEDDDNFVARPPRTGVLASDVKRLRGTYFIRQRQIRWMVPLPQSFDFFLKRNIHQDPFAAFTAWLAEKLGGIDDDQALHVSEIHLHKSDFDQLFEREKFWWARRGDEDQAHWANLNYGPNEVGYKDEDPVPEFVVPGWVYVGKNAFVARDPRLRVKGGGQARAVEIDLAPLDEGSDEP